MRTAHTAESCIQSMSVGPPCRHCRNTKRQLSCSATHSCWRIRGVKALVWVAAICTNFAIFLAKLGVFTFTGSK